MRKTLAVCTLALAGLAMHASYEIGKRVADHWYNAEPDVMNCPMGHTCAWEEHDATTGACLKNCSVEAPVTWQGDTPSCPAGYDIVADESEALASKDSAHCVR